MLPFQSPNVLLNELTDLLRIHRGSQAGKCLGSTPLVPSLEQRAITCIRVSPGAFVSTLSPRPRARPTNSSLLDRHICEITTLDEGTGGRVRPARRSQSRRKGLSSVSEKLNCLYSGPGSLRLYCVWSVCANDVPCCRTQTFVGHAQLHDQDSHSVWVRNACGRRTGAPVK